MVKFINIPRILEQGIYGWSYKITTNYHVHLSLLSISWESEFVILCKSMVKNIHIVHFLFLILILCVCICILLFFYLKPSYMLTHFSFAQSVNSDKILARKGMNITGVYIHQQQYW